MNGATNVIQVFQLYNGDTWLFALFLAAAAYLLFRLDARNRRSALLAMLAACLLVFNELIFLLAKKFMDGAQTYYRFLWILPVVPVLAYAAVDVIASCKKRSRRILAAALVFAAVALAGTPYLNAQSIQRPGKPQYLNASIAEISRLINADRQTAYPDKEYVKVACEYDLMMSLRLYDASFWNAILRETYQRGAEPSLNSSWEGRQYSLWRMVNGKKVRVRRIRKVLEKSAVQYVVIANKYNWDKRMLAAGCAIVGATEQHTIYRAPQ